MKIEKTLTEKTENKKSEERVGIELAKGRREKGSTVT